MKQNKFERDLAIVNSILDKDPYEVTHDEALTLIGILQVSYHDSGKIEGIFSIDSSAHGCHFCEKMRKASEEDPSIICGKCYDYKQECYRANVLQRHQLNLRILSSVLFADDEIATLPAGQIVRINSSGDIENLTHARNIIRYAKTHAYTHVAVWSKNFAVMKQAFQIEGKPKNLTYIASSYRIDEQMCLPAYADYMFTVYSDEAKLHAALDSGACECNGKKCKDCGFKCYLHTWAQWTNIAELLRK